MRDSTDRNFRELLDIHVTYGNDDDGDIPLLVCNQNAWLSSVACEVVLSWATISDNEVTTGNEIGYLTVSFGSETKEALPFDIDKKRLNQHYALSEIGQVNVDTDDGHVP